MIKKIDELLRHNNYSLASRLLINAFDTYHNSGSVEQLKDLFGNYLYENDPTFDFMTQLELRLFGQENIEFLYRVIDGAVAIYNLDINSRKTLLSLLELVLYAKSYDIVNRYLYKIWSDLEKSNFENRDDIEFALEILRRVASIKDITISASFMTMVFEFSKFQDEFAALILMVLIKSNPNNLNRLLSTKEIKEWKQKKNQKFLKKFVKNLLFEVGIGRILSTIKELNDDALWFLDIFLQIDGVKVFYDGKMPENENYKLSYKGITVNICPEKRSMDEILLFFATKDKSFNLEAEGNSFSFMDSSGSLFERLAA